MARSLTILGATGSIGSSTLDLVRRNREAFRVVALTANCQAAELAALAREFGAEIAVVADETCLPALREALAGSGIAAAAGAQALVEAAARGADITVAAIVGCAGLAPTMAAIECGKVVALANKEALVSAGEVMTAAVARSGATLLPVDSEHNAIFQCLPGDYRCGVQPRGVRRVVLTASGGPFRETPADALQRVTPAEAVRHPKWSMGPKISVDSATLMNKGLELIEAAALYELPSARIDVVVHPESVIHSLVEYVDGSTLAQLGHPDMRVPIAHALAWPDRCESGVEGLDLARLGRMRFEVPDLHRFPCLGLARQALERGGHFPNVLNAANEVAVQAFLDGHIGFTGIAQMVERACAAAGGAAELPAELSMPAVLHVDAWTRAWCTQRLLETSHA